MQSRSVSFRELLINYSISTVSQYEKHPGGAEQSSPYQISERRYYLLGGSGGVM